ncbi:MAG: hypothetical protein LBC94_07825 [Desulfovibrio sp.]|jgi:flagellin-like hook-associated protein FlgL|nr:hypothetical protein [Desulfovibrio sp.]
MGTLIQGGGDLAAELILNKIMNGQLKTSTGKTVTAAGRTMAARLSSEGYAAGAAAAAVSSGIGYVQAAQSQTSEMVAKLQEMRNNLAAAADDDAVKAAAAQAETMMTYLSSELATAKIGNQNLFGSTTLDINAGMGATIGVLGKDVATDLSTLDSAAGFSTLATSGGSTDTAIGAIDAAIAALNGYIADYAIQYKQLTDRAAVLNDLGAGFDEAAQGQSITATQGASGLLAAMLGGTTST